MSNELNLLELIVGASIPVKIVMGLLLAASIASWFVIFRKRTVLNRALDEAEAFEQRFWSGTEMATLFKEVSHSGDPVGMAGIFEAGFREFARQRQRKFADPRTTVEGAQHAMRAAVIREVDRLEQNLEMLATVGSASPYVGLFGTVWGIMIAFHGLANVREATIAMVAPGITEALIATAMGLFAAIPAVIAYNRYQNKVERINNRYETFQDEFSTLLQRQAHSADVG
ncbi:protein TolQ [Pseudofulvimonas gallinarii]|jgi:biopolymer transport protein TolQ|uniref:Tol-Pal system protein TolQ n=1 Tax=Pseudofulvimonas gallinarii TaxID=634155 RepID=A0A4V3UU26_9GAMM|nr:protein TolQ [Pseudofulvimonas gallinarii]TCT00785.1 cell division and transport-associated protein TolQ [Pseudofulvimonas gallinarii]THD12821.1 protein TolQ [Pseudofulvimonas gallinarii]